MEDSRPPHVLAEDSRVLLKDLGAPNSQMKEKSFFSFFELAQCSSKLSMWQNHPTGCVHTEVTLGICGAPRHTDF